MPTEVDATPFPTPVPTQDPTPVPTPDPTPDPTPVPTPDPTPDPTPVPTTLDPTLDPTPAPVTPVPTPFPPTPTPTTGFPTLLPTLAPTLPCNLAPDARFDEIRALLSGVSDPALFDDPTTPQARALDWLANADAIEPVLCPGASGAGCTRNGGVHPLVQRYVLATFYFATEGDAWTTCAAPADVDAPDAVEEANARCDRVVTPFGVQNDRVGDTSTDAWLGPANECEWGGIACWGADTPNLNLCIDQLDFENDGLAGELPSELSSLDSLRFLILEQGAIEGRIPTEYGDLDRLLILDMDFNELSGEIPEEIYGLQSLQQLDLNDNDITGTISSKIGDLQFLTFFQIDHNQLSSTIPSEMGQLANLRIAFLSDNDLTGEMPAEVCSLRNNTSPAGKLGVLVTDCAGSSPEVSCPCCSSCA